MCLSNKHASVRQECIVHTRTRDHDRPVWLPELDAVPELVHDLAPGAGPLLHVLLLQLLRLVLVLESRHEERDL